MATVHVALAVVQARSLNGSGIPVPNSVPVGTSQTLTSSAINQLSTLAASAAGQVWVVTVDGGDIEASFGAAADAAAAPQWLLLDGAGPFYFAAVAAGEKLAIVDA